VCSETEEPVAGEKLSNSESTDAEMEVGAVVLTDFLTEAERSVCESKLSTVTELEISGEAEESENVVTLDSDAVMVEVDELLTEGDAQVEVLRC
jgi:hypothetical protein